MNLIGFLVVFLLISARFGPLFSSGAMKPIP
jgi:hypothetical protein